MEIATAAVNGDTWSSDLQNLKVHNYYIMICIVLSNKCMVGTKGDKICIYTDSIYTSIYLYIEGWKHQRRKGDGRDKPKRDR